MPSAAPARTMAPYAGRRTPAAESRCPGRKRKANQNPAKPSPSPAPHPSQWAVVPGLHHSRCQNCICLAQAFRGTKVTIRYTQPSESAPWRELAAASALCVQAFANGPCALEYGYLLCRYTPPARCRRCASTAASSPSTHSSHLHATTRGTRECLHALSLPRGGVQPVCLTKRVTRAAHTRRRRLISATRNHDSGCRKRQSLITLRRPQITTRRTPVQPSDWRPHVSSPQSPQPVFRNSPPWPAWAQPGRRTWLPRKRFRVLTHHVLCTYRPTYIHSK